MLTTDLSSFTRKPDLLEGSRWLLVIKSLDQQDRRRRMIEAVRGGTLQRLTPRPISDGLVVTGRLEAASFQIEHTLSLNEPRHVCPLPTGDFLISDISGISLITEKLQIKRRYTNPLFAFLHTITLSEDGRRILVCSTGLDSIVELSLDSGEQTFRWCAWEHGFNPDADGTWLTLDEAVHKKNMAEGRRSEFIEIPRPEHGIITSHRSAHPNAAIYENRLGIASILISIGYSGEVYRIAMDDGAPELVGKFAPLSHGLHRISEGWRITETTKGRWLSLDKAFSPKRSYVSSKLGEKVEGAEKSEWLQAVIPAGSTSFLLLDANRGLIATDLATETLTFYRPDPNWCVQDAYFLST